MQILSRINWVDVLVVIIMIRTSYVAFADGLSHEIFPLFGTIVVFALSLHYYQPFGAAMSHGLGNIPVEITNFIAFLALIIVLGFVVRFLKVVLDKLVKVQWHPVIEKFGGLFAGIVKAYVITAMLLTTFVLAPLSYLQWSVRDRSLTGKYILMAGPEVYAKSKALVSDSAAAFKKAPAKKEPSKE